MMNLCVCLSTHINQAVIRQPGFFIITSSVKSTSAIRVLVSIVTLKWLEKHAIKYVRKYARKHVIKEQRL